MCFSATDFFLPGHTNICTGHKNRYHRVVILAAQAVGQYCSPFETTLASSLTESNCLPREEGNRASI